MKTNNIWLRELDRETTGKIWFLKLSKEDQELYVKSEKKRIMGDLYIEMLKNEEKAYLKAKELSSHHHKV